MGIFGKSKKTHTTTTSTSQSQPPGPDPPPYASQASLQPQIPYGAPYENAPPHNWPQSQQNANPSQIYGTHQLQGSGIWLAPQHQPIHITQNIFLAPPLPQRLNHKLGQFNLSANNLLEQGVVTSTNYISNGVHEATQHFGQGGQLCDLISSKFDNAITLIDGDNFRGQEDYLAAYHPSQLMLQQEAGTTDKALLKSGISKGMMNTSIATALSGSNYFSKVDLYANSSLPPNLPPLKLYMDTYPLLNLAAKYSEQVYSKPEGQERQTHVDADWTMGTKAMVVKSVPMDTMNYIVIAIRGTQTFMDWAVNLKTQAVSPSGFLDDPGNLCHAGFLSVARKMVRQVAAHLQQLLEENPSRAKYSLIITGHSAGGAVASLLYCHMLAASPEAKSELNTLTGRFKRIHCVSFGAPPISLLPLAKPQKRELRKSIFMSFVNEGDPVTRADKPYVRSLIDLYSSPAPGQSCFSTLAPPKLLHDSKSSSSLPNDKTKRRPSPKKSHSSPAPTKPIWKVPEATLSNAGRIVLLRSLAVYEGKGKKRERMNEGVVAQVISDEMLRGVVFGDPVCHMMKLYARRIQVLATNAITGRS